MEQHDQTENANVNIDEKVVEEKEDTSLEQCGKEKEEEREKNIKNVIKEENSEMENDYSLIREPRCDPPKNANSNTDENTVVEEPKRRINDAEGGEKKKIYIIDKCRGCLDKPSEIVYLPCAHMVLCVSCTLLLKNCPSCKEKIKYAFRPIL